MNPWLGTQASPGCHHRISQCRQVDAIQPHYRHPRGSGFAESGVTRDRKEGRGRLVGREFVVVDTGGIDFWSDEPLSEMVRRQAQVALCEAAVAIFCGRQGRAGGAGPGDRRPSCAAAACR